MRSATVRRITAAMVVLAAAGTACQPGDRAERGETLIVGVRSDFRGFNPITTGDYYGLEIVNYALFTPLITYDADLEPAPHLADSWEMHGDTALTLRLRQDVRWHDGQPVTAHDVLFTFERAKDPAAASLLATAFLARVESAAIVDDYAIWFRLAHPHAQALENFAWAPAPRHLLENVAAAELVNAPFNRQPVGSGPFRFAQWLPNDRLVLDRNPDYPDALGGAPQAARVVFRIIPEVATLQTELLTGGIHVNLPLQPDQANQLRGQGAVEVLSFPGRTFHYVGWNHDRPPFDNPQVRRALTLAVNRQEIIESLLFGEGQPAVSTIPPWHPYAPRLDALPFDLAEAGRLLDQAGWRLPAAGGVRVNAQGQPLRFTLLASDDALRRAVVEVLNSQFRRLGVEADIRVTEFQTMLSLHRNRDFDAVFTNWVLDNFEVSSAPFSLFHSAQADIPQSPNRSSVRIPRLDRAIERGAAATTDGEAQDAWREYARILQEEQPVTLMFWTNELSAIRDGVQNVEMDPRGRLRTLHEWTIRGR
jgi:peptide/nickel transport system substrate-binding protein